ncbi:hypothetical protein PIB30_071016 [Stylosanthes scabra]|uniref:Uncharacterized protein n=1 Tax=Stylosanthes scabra TaxID=79078 RepID=A0ABU6VNV8_9FABA|nr:hypothetical protein [Stylosanthes scabra]
MKYDGTSDPLKHINAFEAMMNLDGVSDAICCKAFPVTLSGDFRRHLTSKEITSMEEIHRIAHEYMRDEDFSKVVSWKRKNPTSQPNKGGSQGPSTLPTRPPVPRVGKFNTYTPLNASLIEVYQQIPQRGILPKLIAWQVYRIVQVIPW